MPAVVLLFALLILPLPAQEKWPTHFETTPPKLKRLPNKDEALAWETPHFILVSETELPKQRLLDFTQVIESVPRLFQSLPLSLWVPPQDSKVEIRLCRDETSFVARGGPLGAAGYYHGRQAIVLVRGDLLLNPPQATGTSLQLSPDGDLLIHELCHLAMHRYGAIPPWLAEGIAEYFSSCHLGKGRYDFTDTQRKIQQHIRKFYPHERFPILVLPRLAEVASLSSKEWIRTNRLAPPEDRYRSYAAALLLAHYYLEGGSKRRGQLSDFFQQRLTDKRNTQSNPLEKVPADLEKKLILFWKSKGLILDFEALD
ncbi:MAG: hypothetical protein ACSHYB_15735 [Roseibacillus sp.]